MNQSYIDFALEILLGTSSKVEAKCQFGKIFQVINWTEHKGSLVFDKRPN